MKRLQVSELLLVSHNEKNIHYQNTGNVLYDDKVAIILFVTAGRANVFI